MFASGQRCWHIEYGYVKYNRPLKSQEGFSYVEKRGVKELQLVNNADLLKDKPVQLTKEERFWAFLGAIKKSPTAYYVAGWLAAHATRFNISHPPVQAEIIPDILLQYHIEAEDGAVTVSSDKTSGWSCHVASDKAPNTEAFTNETKVIVSNYFLDDMRMQMQAREFVMGFLGDFLGFRFNAEWLNRKHNNPDEFQIIRNRVPLEFLADFDIGAS